MVLLIGCDSSSKRFRDQGCSERIRVWLRLSGRILNDCLSCGVPNFEWSGLTA